MRKLLIAAAAVLAVLILVAGGIYYVTSSSDRTGGAGGPSSAVPTAEAQPEWQPIADARIARGAVASTQADGTIWIYGGVGSDGRVSGAHEGYDPAIDSWKGGEELPAARPVQTTPLYDAMLAEGAVMGDSWGLETPLWFAPKGAEPKDVVSFHRSNDFPHVKAECLAVRHGVGITETANYAKYEVLRPGAEAFLSRMMTNRMPRYGRIVLTLGDVAGKGSPASSTRKSSSSAPMVVSPSPNPGRFSSISRASMLARSRSENRTYS